MMDFAFEPLAAGDNIFYFFSYWHILFWFILGLILFIYIFLEKKKEIQHCRCTGQGGNRKQRAHLRLFQEGSWSRACLARCVCRITARSSALTQSGQWSWFPLLGLQGEGTEWVVSPGAEGHSHQPQAERVPSEHTLSLHSPSSPASGTLPWWSPGSREPGDVQMGPCRWRTNLDRDGYLHCI